MREFGPFEKFQVSFLFKTTPNYEEVSELFLFIGGVHFPDATLQEFPPPTAQCSSFLCFEGGSEITLSLMWYLNLLMRKKFPRWNDFNKSFIWHWKSRFIFKRWSYISSGDLLYFFPSYHWVSFLLFLIWSFFFLFEVFLSFLFNFLYSSVFNSCFPFLFISVLCVLNVSV